MLWYDCICWKQSWINFYRNWTLFYLKSTVMLQRVYRNCLSNIAQRFSMLSQFYTTIWNLLLFTLLLIIYHFSGISMDSTSRENAEKATASGDDLLTAQGAVLVKSCQVSQIWKMKFNYFVKVKSVQQILLKTRLLAKIWNIQEVNSCWGFN